MEELKLKSHTITTAKAYSFRFEWGWAIFTLNDDTGELSIHSDWGTYGHRWNTGSLGNEHTLHTFLAQCDGDYVTRKLKLHTKSKELDDEVDKKATRQLAMEVICERRRGGLIEKDEARGLVNELDEWESCGFDLGNAEYLSVGSFLRECGTEPYEVIRKKPSARFLFMRNKLWPFFTKWLNENVVQKQEATEAVHG